MIHRFRKESIMKNLILGINEPAMSDLILDIVDSADRIQDIFNRIHDKMVTFETSCKSDISGIVFQNKIAELEKSYPIIKQNILSYSEDLTFAMQHINEMVDITTRRIESAANDVRNKAKMVKY